MLTPSSIASTSPGRAPGPSTSISSSAAGRLLTTLASRAAIPATASSPTRLGAVGTIARRAAVSPLAPAAATTIPMPNTNRQKPGDADPTSPSTVIRRRTSARPPSTAAPIAAGHTGSTPTSDATPNPTSVNPTTTSANSGTPGSSPVPVPFGAPRRSARNHQPSTAYSTAIATTHGSAISAVNPRNVSPDAAKASRLVRFETGSRVDAELA